MTGILTLHTAKIKKMETMIKTLELEQRGIKSNPMKTKLKSNLKQLINFILIIKFLLLAFNFSVSVKCLFSLH